MNMIVSVLILVAAFGSTVTAIEIPNGFKVCHRTEPKYSECLADAIRDAIVFLSGGLKSYKILPLEPLAVDSVKIGASEGTIALKQEYRNIKLHGLTKDLKIKNLQMDLDNLVLKSDSYNPQVDFVADYKINGKILLLPIKGSGKSNITMYNLKTHTEMYGERYEKNGETYMKIKKFIVQFDPARVTLRLDNLFDGDTLLGEQMNRFINENSDLLFKELQAAYEETFGLVFAKISNNIFSRLPINNIFPE